MSLGLRYIGNPFVDAGLASITAFVGKKQVAEIDMSDLERVANYLKDIYLSLKGVQGQLVTLFHNSGFTQPSFKPPQKAEYADGLLYGFRLKAAKLDVPCTFFPEKAAYRYVHRQYVPLLSADNIINFSPEGSGKGLPISGEALLAIAAMPLGAFRCKNWLVFHHLSGSDSDDMTVVLVRDAVKQFQETISLLRSEPETKWPTLKRPRQVYIDKILAAESKIHRRHARLGDVTGYHFTNYGTSPSIEIVRLENDVWDFISTAKNDAEAAWNRFLAVGQVDADYNKAYDALFDLPYNYQRFMPLLKQVKNWTFTEIFLRKVVKMNQRRIELLKDLGQRFVAYMDRHERDKNGKVKLAVYYQLSRASKRAELRKAVLENCETAFKKEGKTLLTTDEFVLAFESPEDRYESWTLARDIVTFRMLDQLSELGVTADEDADEPKPIPIAADDNTPDAE
jgi:CRISPR-associated protein Cst1